MWPERGGTHLVHLALVGWPGLLCQCELTALRVLACTAPHKATDTASPLAPPLKKKQTCHKGEMLEKPTKASDTRSMYLTRTSHRQALRTPESHRQALRTPKSRAGLDVVSDHLRRVKHILEGWCHAQRDTRSICLSHTPHREERCTPKSQSRSVLPKYHNRLAFFQSITIA